MNHDTGKSYKLNSDDISKMQDMAAWALEMERGESKMETGKDFAHDLSTQHFTSHQSGKVIKYFNEKVPNKEIGGNILALLIQPFLNFSEQEKGINEINNMINHFDLYQSIQKEQQEINRRPWVRR